MSGVLVFLGMVAFATVSAVLLRAYGYARRKTPLEEDRTPTYVERAGGRFDNFNWTIPFVRVAVFEDVVEISSMTRHVVFRRGDVTAIEREEHFFSIGLRLRHDRVDVPATILLWPRDFERLQAALRASLLGEHTSGLMAGSLRSARDRRGVLGAATTHWRSFIAAWLFPIVLAVGEPAATRVGMNPIFWVLAFPLFLWSYFRAAKPLLDREIGLGAFVVWVAVVPFVVAMLAGIVGGPAMR